VDDVAAELSRLSGKCDTLLEKVAQKNQVADSGAPAIQKNTGAILAIRNEFAADDNRMRRTEFCTTGQELYRKYGMPDSTMRSGQSMLWIYYPDDSDDGIAFQLNDGIVDHIENFRSPNPRSKRN
jgi:hypothetical protein